MKTQTCSYNEMFFGGKSNRHWHWDSVKTIVTVAIYIFRFEQMRSLQTVVIKAWLASTINFRFWTFYLFKCFDGHYPSDNSRF